MRVALFGGSFNPPHVGHVMVVSWLLAARSAQAEQVWLLPTGSHPFGKTLAPFADRVAMAAAAMSVFGDRVRVESIEGDREGTTYTIDTVELLRAKHPGVRFSLVVGTDVMHDRPKWKEFDRLVTLVDLLPVRRAGVAGSEVDDPANPSPLFPEVSSTDIRQRLVEGKSIDGLVPDRVREIIRSRNLYAAARL
jgi:nicotinate-nucleotide adenylyltransferase